MDSSDHTRCKRQVDRKYNVEKEHKKVTEAVDDAMEFFMYIKLALALGEEFPAIITLINPPFNPLKTIGKYSA